MATNSEVLERLLGRVDNIAADVEDITRTETDDIKVHQEHSRHYRGVKTLVGTSQGEVSETGTAIRSSHASCRPASTPSTSR